MIAEGDLPTRFELPAATLRQIIEKTRFAISSEETRYYLMGIFFHVVDDQLRAAATDGHRLARVTVAEPDGADGMPDVIVPRKCVQELYRLLEELEGTVEISLSPTKIRFGLGSAILTSKLIDGTFPDYNRVIPTANDKLLKLDPKSFSAGVDRVSTIASEKTRAVKISVDRDKVTLSVTSPENGVATEELAADYGSRRDRDRLQRPISARHPGRDRRRHRRGPPRRRRRADLLRENDKSNALYVLMPMRVEPAGRNCERIETSSMPVSRLALTDFRSYSSALIEPGPGSGFVLLFGENGAGKTNVLEAVSLLLRGAAFAARRCRTWRDRAVSGVFAVAANVEAPPLAGGEEARSAERGEYDLPRLTYFLAAPEDRGISMSAPAPSPPLRSGGRCGSTACRRP